MYVALLRGINVGGMNRVPMKELKTVFEDYGFKNVKTYINSGNVLFESEEQDPMVLKSTCEELVTKHFQVANPIIVLATDTLHLMFKKAPDWWNKDKDSKHNAIFVIPPMQVKDVVATVGEIKRDYENIAIFDGIIFWSAPIKTFSRTTWAKVSGMPVYQSLTVRNANTFTKLVALA